TARGGTTHADGARRERLGARGAGNGAAAARGGADAAGEQVDGVVVGAEGAAGDDRGDTAIAAAFGLHDASAGGDSGPWLAVALAGALLLAAGGGGLAERRRR
ncbi:MAG TPA: hypothetical protein VLK58_01140, partial [Conexibacter sp.]|nr:hypothetical protein [Conexibacter sp.]